MRGRRSRWRVAGTSDAGGDRPPGSGAHDQDVLGGRKVAVVIAAFAWRYSQGRPMLGRHLAPGACAKVVADREIIGIVGELEARRPARGREADGLLPDPHHQRPDRLAFYVRLSRTTTEIAAVVGRIARELDPGLPVFDLRPMGAASRARRPPSG